jgi:hypothetical protein
VDEFIKIVQYPEERIFPTISNIGLTEVKRRLNGRKKASRHFYSSIFVEQLNFNKAQIIIMKKLFLVAMILSCVAGVTMAQSHPAKKTSTANTTKTEIRKDSVGGATASHMGKHKGSHKKGAHKKT